VIGCTRDEFDMVIFRDCGLCLETMEGEKKKY
jgi:hypothetical protein